MRVLHVIPSFTPAFRYGGPIVSVLRLCQALVRAGVTIEVATTNADGPSNHNAPTDRLVEVEGVNVRYFRRVGRLDFALSPNLAWHISRCASRFDLVHITSTFSFPSAAAGHFARQAGTPYVVSPRGSLQEWSLQQKRWKKVPYWNLYEKRHLGRATAIHATADMELEAVRGLLPNTPCFVVPNGVEQVPQCNVDRLPKRIVFLGRIHKKKGFDVLIPALRLVALTDPLVETVIAGPNEDGEWERVERLLAGTSPRPRVRYIGPVNGPERFALLASAAVFVLPSHSENFGITVVEALACGTPVVVSRNCPWRSVEDVSAGFWVQNTPPEIARAILDIVTQPRLGCAMGEAGKQLASTFSWNSIGCSMAEQYDRLARPRSSPRGG